MGSDSNEGSLSADVLVELILEINEAVVSIFIESDISKNSGDNERSDLLSLQRAVRRGQIKSVTLFVTFMVWIGLSWFLIL